MDISRTNDTWKWEIWEVLAQRSILTLKSWYRRATTVGGQRMDVAHCSLLFGSITAAMPPASLIHKQCNYECRTVGTTYASIVVERVYVSELSSQALQPADVIPCLCSGPLLKPQPRAANSTFGGPRATNDSSQPFTAAHWAILNRCESGVCIALQHPSLIDNLSPTK